MIFFFASAGASAGYLTVSEVFPLEVRAKAIAVFFAIAQCFGFAGSHLYGHLIGNGQDPNRLYVGYLIGGPVYIPGKFNTDKSKYFWYWGQEWVKYRYTDSAQWTVPSNLMRQGNFSELLPKTINDPLTKTPFPNNVIPRSRLSPNGIALLNVLPQPVPGFQQGSSNWIGTKSTHSDLRKDTFKVGYLISETEHLSVSGTNTPWHFNTPFEDTFGRMG